MFAARANSPVSQSARLRQFWADLSAPILELARAKKLYIVEHDFERNQGDIPYSSGLDADLRDRYRSELSAQNVWMQALRLSDPGDAYVGAELVPNWELVRTTFYRHWLRPQRVLHAVIGVISRSRDNLRCLLALREASYAPFTSYDKKVLKFFLPELRSASELVTEMTSLQQSITILRDLVEEISTFSVVVDGTGRPVFLNGTAKAFLAQSHGLNLRDDVLVCNSSRDTRCLHDAILSVVTRAESHRSAESVVVSQKTGYPPVLLHIVPLRHPAVDATGHPTSLAVVFVAPVAHSTALEGVMRFYGMTPAEIRLAAMIIGGQPLRQVARELHITCNTARTHMKRIYAKTETHSQAALLRLLMAASTNTH
jgi:DNA-binding CsgD family transcriptional regulator